MQFLVTFIDQAFSGHCGSSLLTISLSHAKLGGILVLNEKKSLLFVFLA